MKRYRNICRLISLVLLVTFLTTLSGISAAAGHDCCGNCMPPGPLHTETAVVSDNCCPAKPDCTCTLQSDGGMALPVYTLVQVNPAGENPVAGPAMTLSGGATAPDSRPCSIPPRFAKSHRGSRPIYLTNQSLLC